MVASDRALSGAHWRQIPSVRALTTRDLLFTSGLALALIGSAVLQSPYLRSGALVWAAGLLAMVASTTFRTTSASLLGIRIGRQEGVALAATIVVAGVLRLWSLEMLPNGIHIDEAVMGLIARDILAGEGPHPFGFAFISDPAPLMYVKALFMAVLGEGMFPQRLVAALAGLGGVATLWLFGRPLFGSGVALLGTALLAVTASHIVFSRLALTIIEIPFLGMLAVALVWRGFRTEQVAWHLLGGVVLGLAQYANFGARAFVMAVAALYLVQLMANRHAWWPTLRGGVLAGVGMVAVLGPQLAYIRDDPFQLVDRLRFRSVFRRWDQATEIHQTSDPVQVMIGQAVVNVRAFIDMPDRGTFFEFAHEPMLYGLVAALFVIGVGFAVWRIREPRYATLLLICGSVLLGGIMSSGAPQFHRLVPMAPVACLLAAIGLLGVVGLLDRAVRRFRPTLAGTLPLAVSVIVVGLTTWDAASALLVRYPAERPWQPHSAWARWVAGQPADRAVYVAGAPDVRAWDERLRFLAERRPLVDMPNPTVGIPMMLADNGGSTIGLSPRLSDWQPLLEQTLPGSTFEPVLGPDGTVAIIQVTVPPQPHQATSPGGLKGTVTIDDSAGTDVLQRFDAALVFREASGLSDKRTFSAEWTGVLLTEQAGTYRIELFTDGGGEVEIDGKSIISAKTAPTPRSVRAEVRLTQGKHQLTVTYSYVRGPGTFELRWQPPGGQRTVIPPSALRPE